MLSFLHLRPKKRHPSEIWTFCLFKQPARKSLKCEIGMFFFVLAHCNITLNTSGFLRTRVFEFVCGVFQRCCWTSWSCCWATAISSSSKQVSWGGCEHGAALQSSEPPFCRDTWPCSAFGLQFSLQHHRDYLGDRRQQVMLGSTTSSTTHSASASAQDCDSGIKEKTTPKSHISLFSKAP